MDFLDKIIDFIEEKNGLYWVIMDYNGFLFFKKFVFSDHIIDYVV